MLVNQRHVRSVGSAAVVAAVAAAFVASAGFARVANNTIDPIAIVSDDGRHLVVTGPFECTDGETLHLRVTVTQRSTGAVAEGRTIDTCTGGAQQWEVDASSRGAEPFEEGPATAVGVGRTTDHGETTDAHQWLVEITLVAE